MLLLPDEAIADPIIATFPNYSRMLGAHLVCGYLGLLLYFWLWLVDVTGDPDFEPPRPVVWGQLR